MKSSDIISRFFICQLNELDALKDYFEKMALQGYILQRKNGHRYSFKKSIPQKLTYSVEVFNVASDFDAYRTEQNNEYIDYCETSGWLFVCSDGKIQIFSTSKESIPLINSDMTLKLKTINKCMLKTNLIMWIIFSLLGFFIITQNLFRGVISLFSSYLAFSIIPMWSTITLLSLYNIVDYFIWYRKSKKQVQQGGSFSYIGIKKRNIKNYLPLVLLLLWFLSDVFYRIVFGNSSWWTLLLLLGVPFSIMGLGLFVRLIIKKIGAPVVYNRIGVMGVGTILGFTLVSAITFSVIGGSFLRSNHNTEIIRWKEGSDSCYTTVYHDELPLSLEDLGIKINENEKVSTFFNNHGDFLINNNYGYEEAINSKNYSEPNLCYNIYQVKNSWLYNKVVNELMTRYNSKYIYVSFDNLTAFSVNTLYYKKLKNTNNNDKYDDYILLYDNMIITLRVNFKLSNNQMQVVYDRLVKQ